MTSLAARFTSIRFSNYKALRKFSVSLERINILVGANNAGKSTILGAFRILSEGLRRAGTRKAQLVNDGERDVWGYPVDLENLPISTENIFTDYDDSNPAKVFFRVSNGNELTLAFPSIGSCVLVCNARDKIVRTPAEFQRAYPVRIGFVPVLGPVEHNEPLYQKEAARKALLTHRASRNFRNIWYHYPEDFVEFRRLIASTWPGMDIEPPQVQNDGTGARLVMFCPEQRYPREIFWAGFGFQVWCQMLTYIMRSVDDSLLVIDEPDIYLHSDLQRQLLSILDTLGPDILVATHSTEIISEAEPRDLLLIRKGTASGKRLTNVTQLQTVFGVLGSNANPILTQVAKSRRVLFVEGKDFQLLGAFAKRLGKSAVANRADFAVIPVDGFSVQKARDYAMGFELALGVPIVTGIVFDRDYRSDTEINEIEASLREFASLAHIHRRKELENYTLVPAAIASAIGHRAAERAQRTGKPIKATEDIDALLKSITETMRPMVFGQYLARRTTRERAQRPGLDPATINEAAMIEFDELWKEMDSRLAMVPGKDVLSLLNQHLQEQYEISLSALSIVSAMAPGDVADDLRGLIDALESLRKVRPTVEREETQAADHG